MTLNKQEKRSLLLKILLLLPLIGIFFYIIFFLPYIFPNKNPTASLSYAFGFNNKVSIIGTLVAIFIFWLLTPVFMSKKTFSLPRIFGETAKDAPPRKTDSIFWIFAAIYILISIFFLVVFNNPYFHGEDDFFIKNIDLLQMGKVPYQDFWFHFGPGLIYIPLLIKKTLALFAVSTRTSYYIFYGLMNLLGLYLLYFLIKKFEIEQRYKNLIFGVIAILQINFTMGVQYTLIRTLPPFYLLFQLNRYFTDYISNKSSLEKFGLFALPFIFLAIVFILFIETGIAFFVSILVYLLAISIIQKNKPALVSGSLLLGTIPLLLMTVPGSVLHGIINYAGGGQNFPVFPSPPVLIYLFSLLFSVPLLIQANYSNTSKPIFLSYATLCICLMPGAFGRCDPGHVFFYGIGVFILTAVIFAKNSPKAFKIYIASIILIFGISFSLGAYSVSGGKTFASLYLKFGKHLFSEKQILELSKKLGLDKNKTLRILKAERESPKADYSILSKYESIATPLMIDNNLYNYLLDNGKFVPEYYLYTINVDDENQLQRKINDLNRNTYIIVPKNALEGFNSPQSPEADNRFFSRLLLFPIKIPDFKPAPDMGRVFMNYVVLKYREVDTFGEYCIYKKKSH